MIKIKQLLQQKKLNKNLSIQELMKVLKNIKQFKPYKNTRNQYYQYIPIDLLNRHGLTQKDLLYIKQNINDNYSWLIIDKGEVSFGIQD